jgi:hypothetical protein
MATGANGPILSPAAQAPVSASSFTITGLSSADSPIQLRWRSVSDSVSDPNDDQALSVLDNFSDPTGNLIIQDPPPPPTIADLSPNTVRANDPNFQSQPEIHILSAPRLVQGQDVGDEIRFGAGFRFQTLQLDYALARFGSALGATHRFTLTMRFGEGAVKTATGLKPDLVKYYLSQAQEELAAGSYHDAVINANNVLEIDPRNTQALQILFDAGQKAKEPGPLPEVKPESTQPIPPVDHLEVVPQQETPSPAAPAQKPEEIKTEPSAPSEQPTGAPAAQPESKPAEAAPQAPPAQNNPTPAPEPEKKGEPKP